MMASKSKIAEFPEVEAKLQKPTKQSAFERQRAEAEAKRRREEAETKAVYESFVKSFDNDENDDDGRGFRDGRSSSSRPPGPLERSGLGAAGKRHFGSPAGRAPKSGPGSLGTLPPSFGKKRPYDVASGDQREREESRRRQGITSKVFGGSDDEEEVDSGGREEEKAISKPTLRLANLPPNTSTAAIKALITPNLTVENVKILPPVGPGGIDRKSSTAIVTLSKDSPASEIDAAVSVLQNRYLGFGFYLSLHRYLSSAAISSTLASTTSNVVSHPFGAKRVTEAALGSAHAPSTHHGRGFAPPASFGPPVGGPVDGSGLLHVPIQAPKDVKKLRMIHKVIESVLEHGLEFEALLMSRPEVQRDEKWAWMWDARSEGGIWYRWRLWEIITGGVNTKSKAKFIPIFEGSHAWRVPDQALPYEYATTVDEFVSDPDYNSSDGEDFGDDQGRPAENEKDDTFLNPIEKSKLAHFLARLPTTLAKIRKGDIARITAFAITHASRGSDEIVEMIVSNVERPLTFTSANPDHKRHGREDEIGEASREGSPGVEDKNPVDATDMSGACLVGLYVVSDILSCSSTSGIRHAWRYRQLFESALRNHKTFEALGSMAEKHNWGRLRAEKWKRSVGLVMSLWEGWCVFPVETHEYFVSSFEKPPSLDKEVRAPEEDKKGSRWKAIDAARTAAEGKQSGFRPIMDSNDTGESADHVMEERQAAEDEDSDWALLTRVEYSESDVYVSEDEDLDGEALIDFQNLDLSARDASMSNDPAATAAVENETTSKPAQTRRRLRAVDMFADSGSEDGG